jgi:hypothetical protein
MEIPLELKPNIIAGFIAALKGCATRKLALAA